MSETLREIKLSELTPNPYQPRLNFDPHKLEELAQSILENGILQPIIVRKSGLVGYEILAGERRFRASQLAGLETIPAIIRDYSDSEMMVLAVLENLQRDDLTAIDEAKSYQQLAKQLGLTHEQIGQKLGKSRAYVSNTLRLLTLPDAVIDLVEGHQISAAHARALAGLSDEDLQVKLAQRVVNENMTVRTLEQLVAYYKSAQTDKKSKLTTQDPHLQDLEGQLKEVFGTSVAIQSSKQYKGKIEIPFENLENLNAILDLLLTSSKID
jgi:ParB family chromosome partitioning protein